MKERVPLVTLVTICLTLGNAAADENPIDFFEKKIRPVLIEHCYGCHNSSKAREGGLALDSRDSIRAASDTGTAVVGQKRSFFMKERW